MVTLNSHLSNRMITLGRREEDFRIDPSEASAWSKIYGHVAILPHPQSIGFF